MRLTFLLTIVCGVLLCCGEGTSDDHSLRIAVASNFAPTLRQLAQSYTEEFGQKVAISSGSTGVLFAQIENGAPFDLFLAADETRPQLLIDENLAVGNSPTTYAIGRLVLACAAGEDIPQDLKTLLARESFTLAVANERLAPFGVAAMEVLRKEGALEGHPGLTLVRGENAAHAWHFLKSGAADFALGPWSMAQKDTFPFRLLDASQHQPVSQAGVVLATSPENHHAHRFLDFLKRETSRATIKDAGYDVEEP